MAKLIVASTAMMTNTVMISSAVNPRQLRL
jgi:hypothetical protein